MATSSEDCPFCLRSAPAGATVCQACGAQRTTAAKGRVWLIFLAACAWCAFLLYTNRAVLEESWISPAHAAKARPITLLSGAGFPVWLVSWFVFRRPVWVRPADQRRP